jgi:hypothetical protein
LSLALIAYTTVRAGPRSKKCARRSFPRVIVARVFHYALAPQQAQPASPASDVKFPRNKFRYLRITSPSPASVLHPAPPSGDGKCGVLGLLKRAGPSRREPLYDDALHPVCDMRHNLEE